MRSAIVVSILLGTLASGAAVSAPAKKCGTFSINSTTPPANCPGDAPFDLAEKELFSNIWCEGGVAAVKRPYLFVPGTGGTANEDWDSNYRKLMGKNQSTIPGGGLGYDVCYISPPRFMLDDIQDNAQYVVYALKYLSFISAKNGGTKTLPIQAWSQGNLCISWALTFWPSARPKIDRWISFAGDFGGVEYQGVVRSELPKLPVKRQMTIGTNSESVIQQLVPSAFLTAAAAKGNKFAWVKTTSIYSTTDDVIQPEGLVANDTIATSYLGGDIGNILVQQFCPGLLVKHETHQYLNFSYQVVLLALASPRGFATQAEVAAAVKSGKIQCSLLPAPGLTAADVLEVEKALIIATEREHDPRYTTLVEPPLKAYVATFPDNRVHGY